MKISQKKRKKILAVFAHPDDEAFGPGGTLALYAKRGVEIHLLCATKGELGEVDDAVKHSNLSGKRANQLEIHKIREKELIKSAEVLGIRRVEFLNFFDGKLCNANYHKLAEKIIRKIEDFTPQILLTLERRGISGHLDHIAVSLTTTFAFLKTKIPQKLYYFCISEKMRDVRVDDYFIYFPEGYPEREITTRINYSRYWKIKKKAMEMHRSQKKDVERLINYFSKMPKIDNFILQYYRNVKVNLPEKDLFAGIET